MNRVKSQRKALVSLLSVLVALVLACGTIGTRAGDPAAAATVEEIPEAGGTAEPEVQPESVGPETEAAEGEKSMDEAPVEEDASDGGDAGPEETEPGTEETMSVTGETDEEISEKEPLSVPEGVPEEVAKLLVTCKEYYNEEVVAGAAAIPLESNDARYEYITGSPFKVYTMSDRPEYYSSEGIAAKRMETFEVPYWVMDRDGVRTPASGEMTVNALLADSVRCIFSDIFLLEERFPINQLVGFMYRKVGGSGLVNSPILSAHSFGVAIDINNGDYDNDMYLGKGNDLRDRSNPFCIPDDVIDVFASYGWNWGGDFDICSDTMHFQYFGLEFLQYENEEPFPVLEPGKSAKGSVVENLRSRLKKLGYTKKATGKKYDASLVEAVKAFQTDNGLEPDGIVDYETWVPIINQTHDMSYVF